MVTYFAEQKQEGEPYNSEGFSLLKAVAGCFSSCYLWHLYCTHTSSEVKKIYILFLQTTLWAFLSFCVLPVHCFQLLKPEGPSADDLWVLLSPLPSGLPSRSRSHV